MVVAAETAPTEAAEAVSGRMVIIIDRVIVDASVDAARAGPRSRSAEATMIPLPDGVRIWIATGRLT
jgi:hypothetical protein